MDINEVKKVVGQYIQQHSGPPFIETHISFLIYCWAKKNTAEQRIVKLKKNVKFSFLDFSTIEKRKFYCEEEVRLNRRLSPDVYLSVILLVQDKSGWYEYVKELREGDRLVEYGVEMRLLDENKKMDKLLQHDRVGEEEIRKLAEIIADFHARAEVVGDEYNSPAMIAEQIDDLANFRQAIEDSCKLGKKVDSILKKTTEFIARNKKMIEDRKKLGKVKDCHGDLHSANIFLDNGIRIIDCIEFSKDFRCIDVASDIAFMVMDFDAFGKEDLGKIFVETYVDRTMDKDVLKLLNFYKCYRANVRAKIAAIEWLQHKNKPSEERIVKYIKLAERYAKEL